MVGRTTDVKTGYAIDIFTYGPVEKLRPWQARRGGEWYERRADTASDFTFPLETLLPLQNVTWEGKAVAAPAQPYDFLSYEYGQCLGTHVWPWRALLSGGFFATRCIA